MLKKSLTKVEVQYQYALDEQKIWHKNAFKKNKSAGQFTFHKITVCCKPRMQARVQQAQKEWDSDEDDNGNPMKYRGSASWIIYLKDSQSK